MGQDTTRSTRKGLPPWARMLVTPLILLVAAALIWSQLPKGAYSTDLSRIGDGQPALVLIYDSTFMAGMRVMGYMDEIRDDYTPQVHFLVANVGTPDGRRLADQHGVRDGAVLLYSDRGTLVEQLPAPASVEVLRQALDRSLMATR
ncbi:hypothetical protein SAMN05421693_11859 [Ectothiorhodospira magna]|uniref:Uncharacterized protein n=1 Tax=Ectothiorhodospira magna TaxID=867345 RepID=A0A1H9DPH1_9GAMM|nr:hypothetical protein [Ectothiorhodospira magna]SEQ15406.1 hypothetical protein SAMN05421693_11859 [Ectothiorhodospira magna]